LKRLHWQESRTSEFINQAEIPEIVASCFKHPFSKPGAAPLDNGNYPKRNIIVVGHDIASDIAFLQKVGYNVYNLSNLQEFADTADMHRYLRRLESPRNLACVLSELGLIGWNLHNAGNDAVYTLQAMIGIAIEHLKAKRKDKEILVQEKQAKLEE
jgi:DNA polymerase III alpha subunit (gram-positive type)